MISLDGETYEGQSYIRIQLVNGQVVNGQVKAMLDMTGMRDANGFTTAITFRGVRDGNPRWPWAGTD
jgi:hypothetical protein